MARTLVCAAVALLALAALAQAGKREDDALLNWATKEGAKFKVTIGTTARGMRGLIATDSIRTGEEILSIPAAIMLKFSYKSSSEIAPALLKEQHTPCSRFKAYLDTLPKLGEILNGANFPLDLTRYLAVEGLEQRIQTNAFHAQRIISSDPSIETWGLDLTLPEAVGNKVVSLEEYRHAAALIQSRTLAGRTGTIAMMPILDEANHDRESKNYMNRNLTQGIGMRLIAGQDIRKGEEVTINYGTSIRNDDLLFNFGFVDKQSAHMLTVDHHLAHLASTVHMHQHDSVLKPFLGNVDELQREVTRLEDILAQVQERYQSMGPPPETNPAAARLVRDFQEARVNAVKGELSRLQADIAQGGSKLEL